MATSTWVDEDSQKAPVERFDKEATPESWWSIQFIQGTDRIIQYPKNLKGRYIAGVFRPVYNEIQSFAGTVEEIIPAQHPRGAEIFFDAKVVDGKNTWQVPMYGYAVYRLSVLKHTIPAVENLKGARTVQNRQLSWTTPEELYALKQWAVAEYDRELAGNAAWLQVNEVAETLSIDIDPKLLSGRRVAWVRTTDRQLEKLEGVVESIQRADKAAKDIEQVAHVRISADETIDVPLYSWNHGKAVHRFRVLKSK